MVNYGNSFLIVYVEFAASTINNINNLNNLNNVFLDTKHSVSPQSNLA